MERCYTTFDRLLSRTRTNRVHQKQHSQVLYIYWASLQLRNSASIYAARKKTWNFLHAMPTHYFSHRVKGKNQKRGHFVAYWLSLCYLRTRRLYFWVWFTKNSLFGEMISEARIGRFLVCFRIVAKRDLWQIKTSFSEWEIYTQNCLAYTPSRVATTSSFRGRGRHEISFDDAIVLIQRWYNFRR